MKLNSKENIVQKINVYTYISDTKLSITNCRLNISLEILMCND
jgi:hypothetical protein